MKRSELKVLIKECLLEILSESFIDSVVKARVNETLSYVQAQPIIKQQPQRVINEAPDRSTVRARIMNELAPDIQYSDATAHNEIPQALNENDDMAARMMQFRQKLNNINDRRQVIPQQTINQHVEVPPVLVTSNDVMNKIFEDTMKTTVRVQGAAESGYVPQYGDVEEGVDVQSIMTKDWAAIAGLK